VCLTSVIPFDLFDKDPGKRNSPFSESNTDHQQLQIEADLGAIDDQMDFSQVP
jgi:hypothetical protein